MGQPEEEGLVRVLTDMGVNRLIGFKGNSVL